DQALVPYSNGHESFPQRAGSDPDVTYGAAVAPGGGTGGEAPCSGTYQGMLPPQFRGAPLPLPHMIPGNPMMRPLMLVPFPPPPPHMLPPVHHRLLPMIPAPPSNFGLLPHLHPGYYPFPPAPTHFGFSPPRFMSPYGPLLAPMGRPRSPPDGPIITGPESVYGTLPRRPAYEEPIYMPGNVPHIPPQASYQPGNYSTDHYDAYYDSFKRQRNPCHNNKVSLIFKGSKTNMKWHLDSLLECTKLSFYDLLLSYQALLSGSAVAESQASSRKAMPTAENEESSQFWDSYEASVYRKPHLNEKVQILSHS
ncbi:unnamed protein product, partial [Thelazia callipaeda]|uniref:Cleavage and polyadenylation specificity factor subunit 6 n=1 Tax=Thelazia callipaeda TaxID=103827 RepID=A0A0N5CSU9_THECL